MTFLVIYGLFKVICPLMIQFSVLFFGEYRYALLAVSFVATVGALLVFCLDTPQHDELRSIQSAMKRQSSTRNPTEVQQELAIYHKLKNTVVMLWCSFYVFYGFEQSGFLTHITVYTEYMGFSDGIGRYLIASYSGGQLLFRILITVVPKSVKTLINRTGFIMKYLVTMVFIMTMTTTTWLLIPYFAVHRDIALYTLFFVFPITGVCCLCYLIVLCPHVDDQIPHSL